MSVTPKNEKISPKSVSSLGKISQKFLIPCRQVGLSRKRRTPNSAVNIPFLASSDNENPNTSPDSPLARALPKSPLVYSPDALSGSSISRKTAKKSLENNFSDVEERKESFDNATNVSLNVMPLKESSSNNSNVYEKSISDVQDSQKSLKNNIQTSSKFSPSLGKINKKFLTPCRPVGLCKKRQTPKSIVNISFLAPNDNLNSNSKSPLNSPLAKLLPESPSLNSRDELSKTNSTNEKIVRKSFENNFLDVEKQKEEFDNAPNVSITVEPLKESSLNSADVYGKSMSDVQDKRRKKTDIKRFTKTKVNKDLEQCENNNNSANVGRMKINMILDDDDSNIPSKKNEKEDAVMKIPSDNSNIEWKNENKKNYNHDLTKQILSSDSSCSFNSEKSVENNIPAVENKIVTEHSTTNNANEDSDDDFVIVKKKRRVFSENLSDTSESQENSTACNDYKVVNKRKELHIVLARSPSIGNTTNKIDDFTTGIEKMSVLSESDISNNQKSSSSVGGSKTKKKGTKPTKEVQTKFKKQFSNVHSWDDDDAFTSSPETNQNEKVNILKEVDALESRIKEKQKKLENLKQADIYKTKHNIEELDRLIQIWKNGGVSGLNALLRQLQSKNSSITMEMLLANLNISKDVAQIKLGLELEETV